MKMTIKELAKLANASTTTVSLVLNNKPSRISEAKKKEIKALALKHNYQPNFVARNLVTKSSMTIGLLIPDIENLFFSALAKKIENELRKSGYSLILVNSDDNYKNDIKLINNLISRGVDGLLITISNDSIEHKELYGKLLKSIQVPYVMVDRTLGDDKQPQVYFDNQLGGYLATKYLIDKGYKKIGCIIAKDTSLNGFYRYKGYAKALSETNIALDKKIIFEGNFRFNSGYMLAEEVVKNKCDAIFAGNDLMAYGLIRKLSEMHIHVPDDLEVVGYDKLEFSSMLGLNLPSVEQNVKELGIRAVQLLIKLLKKEKTSTKIVLNPLFEPNTFK